MSFEANSRNMSLQLICPGTPLPLTRRIDLLVALKTPIAGRSRAFLVIALVDLGIRISQLDGDIPLQLVLEPHSLHARDGLDHGTLSMCHVTNGADIDGRLPADDLR